MRTRPVQRDPLAARLIDRIGDFATLTPARFAIAIFSTGPAVIYDCLFAELNGYRCSFSKQDTMFPRLSADLKAYGKGSC